MRPTGRLILRQNCEEHDPSVGILMFYSVDVCAWFGDLVGASHPLDRLAIVALSPIHCRDD